MLFIIPTDFLEHLDAEHTFFVLDPTRTFIGGLYPPTLSRRRRDKAKDFVGCINDVRFNGYLLYYYNGTSTVGNARSIGRIGDVSVFTVVTVACLFRSVTEKCDWRK